MQNETKRQAQTRKKSCNDHIDASEKQVMGLSGDKTEEEEDVVYF